MTFDPNNGRRILILLTIQGDDLPRPAYLPPPNLPKLRAFKTRTGTILDGRNKHRKMRGRFNKAKYVKHHQTAPAKNLSGCQALHAERNQSKKANIAPTCLLWWAKDIIFQWNLTAIISCWFEKVDNKITYQDSLQKKIGLRYTSECSAEENGTVTKGKAPKIHKSELGFH